MIRWFRRSRPQPAPRLDPAEARIISAHGLTETQWAALSNTERAKLRETHTKAERYAA